MFFGVTSFSEVALYYSILTDDLWFQNFAVLNFPCTFFTKVESPYSRGLSQSTGFLRKQLGSFAV